MFKCLDFIKFVYKTLVSINLDSFHFFIKVTFKMNMDDFSNKTSFWLFFCYVNVCVASFLSHDKFICAIFT